MSYNNNNNNTEGKSPYHSKTFEVSTVPSPKEYCGFLKRSVTITYGNQKEIVMQNPSDWGDDTVTKSMKNELQEQWDALTIWATNNNVIFIDEIRKRKNYRDEIINGKTEKPKERGSS